MRQRTAWSALAEAGLHSLSALQFLVSFSHRRQVFPAPKRKHATTECVCGSPVYIGLLSILRFFITTLLGFML